MIRLCVFDCDGTLVDSQHAIVDSMAAAFVAEGATPPPAALVRRVVGLTLRAAVAALLPGADAGLHGRIVDGYRRAYGRQRRLGQAAEPLFPGALEAVAAIEEAGWLLGMATGKSRRGALATLAAYGLDGRFVTLQTADSGAGKPAPDLLLKAMAETGAAPQSTVMIGDTAYDMAMARNAGTLSVGVAWGYHDVQDLAASGADIIIDDFAKLMPALERLFGTETVAAP